MTSVDVQWREAAYAAAAGRPDALETLLRSDMPLAEGERALLADLIAGGLRPPAGKRPSVPYDRQRALAAEYLDRTEAGEKAAAVAAALLARCKRDGCKVERTTLLGWVREMRDIEVQMQDDSSRIAAFRSDARRLSE